MEEAPGPCHVLEVQAGAGEEHFHAQKVGLRLALGRGGAREGQASEAAPAGRPVAPARAPAAGAHHLRGHLAEEARERLFHVVWARAHGGEEVRDFRRSLPATVVVGLQRVGGAAVRRGDFQLTARALVAVSRGLGRGLFQPERVHPREKQGDALRREVRVIGGLGCDAFRPRLPSGRLLRERHALISEATIPYLRDTADHAMQVVDVIESYRELCGSLVDVYLSSMSNRTNAVMRVLTVIATIFIPLTFLAGVYGMNFDTARPLNMPELGWSGGYLLFWAVCLLVAAALLFAFRRLGWLGSGRTGAPPPGA
ncbi:MAG: hypothetical protein HY775_08795 [Acidobacteria bacterium]|nr:hypothetical protein [Acidobacteriota bacterium]